MAVGPAGGRNQKLAREVWGRMFDFLMRTAPERQRSLGRRGLTPNDARALSSLDREAGRTMRDLAEEWECDASNATWIVDRLERSGLAERREVPNDRRVRQVVLTTRGEQVRTELLDEFHTPPAELVRLNRKDLEALARAMDKLWPSHPMRNLARCQRDAGGGAGTSGPGGFASLEGKAT